MIRLAVYLFFTIVLCMATVGPTIRELASDGDNCEDCPCDQQPNPDHNEKHLPCPPQCAACFCFVLSVAPAQKPVEISPPEYVSVEEFFEPALSLCEEAPRPPFQPPKA